MINRLFARIPVTLPTSTTALESFTKDILATYNLPLTGEYQSAVASAIQNATQAGSHKVSKYAIYSFITRAFAMRAAFQKLRELQEIEKQAATPKPESPLDGSQAPESATG